MFHIFPPPFFLQRTDAAASVVHHKPWLPWFPTKLPELHLNAAHQQPSAVLFMCAFNIMKLVLQTMLQSKGGRWVGAPFSVPLPRSRGVYSATRGVNAFLHSRQSPYAWAAVQHANQQLLSLPNSFIFSYFYLAALVPQKCQNWALPRSC